MTIIISLVIIFLTTVGQILLKIGANQKTGHQFLNRYVISGYLVFVLTIVFSYILMKVIPLKYFTVIMSSTYVVVMFASRMVLNETIKKDRIIGTVLITPGVFVFLA
jgi:uncharacterized membrane protein